MIELNDVVLVVDDSPETLGMLNAALESAGMTTLVALEGRQALNIAQKMLPDIILLDAIMPNLDGFTTCQKLKTDPDLCHIPVIFMTGLTDSESIVKGFEVGGVDYVTKPINPHELVARIRVHLANARATLGAQTALDTAGHNICAVDVDGKLVWATPLVEQRINQLHPQGWFGAGLDQHFAQWLKSTRSPDDAWSCVVNHETIHWKFLGYSKHQEALFHLVNKDLPDELTILTEEFGLTAREAEVLLWIAKGKTNREAAQILELSPRTINKHLEQVFRKIGVENRTTAAAIAVTALQKRRGF